MSKKYHELISKENRTKEENRELETLKKLAKKNGFDRAIENIEKLPDVTILRYPTEGLYRVQTKINGKDKTIVRVKTAKKDTYILVRETTAKELGKDYEIINYNLPAGYHVNTAQALYDNLKEIIEYHNKRQTA